MAQTNFTPLQLYHSVTPAAVPSAANLLPGELALNIADGKLFYEDIGGVVQELSGGLAYVYKTANYTASDKEGVLTDTSGGVFTVTLPATPAVGDQVVVADAGSNWGTNNLTVGRNGETIGGLAENLTCDITGASVQLVYDGTTWEVYAQIGGNGGTAVTLTGTQTLTNKTLTAPTIASANLTTALTLAGVSGTNGQVLTSAGSGLPSWTTVGSGALTLLSTVTASASATVDMETTFSSTYDAYLIIGAGIVISSDGGSFSCRLKIGGSYSTTDYKGHFMQVASGSTTYSATANATSSIGIATSVGNVTNEGLNFTMKVYLPSGATLRNMVTGEVVYTRDSADVLQGGAFLGGNTVAGAVTGVRFLPSSGTITSGVFRLYGLANS